MMLFRDVLPFLQENGVAPANHGELHAILTDPHKSGCLHVELVVVIDLGKHFVKATYTLWKEMVPWYSHVMRLSLLLRLSSKLYTFPLLKLLYTICLQVILLMFSSGCSMPNSVLNQA